MYKSARRLLVEYFFMQSLEQKLANLTKIEHIFEHPSVLS